MLRGAALQCRITTEDPANGFRPDTGRITTYRSPGGAGVRLDGGTTYTGAEVSAHFDSMLAKLDLSRPDLPDRGGAGPARGGGVPDPRRVHQHRLPRGRAGGPRLRRRQRHDVVHRDPPAAADRPVVGRPRHQAAQLSRRRHRQPAVRRRAGEHRPRHQAARRWTCACPRRTALASSCSSSGRSRSPGALRAQQTVAVTDTTFRDAHQSLLATRVRTRDLVAVAGHVARTTPQLWSLEAWGGATYDVALRFLSEDPWERLAALRAGGAEHLPADAAARAQHGRLHALPHRCHRRLRRRGGRDRHRRLPHLRRAQRRRADASCHRRGPRDRHEASPRSRSATPATCPIPARTSTRSTTTSAWPSASSHAGADVLAIKDMAGLLRAPAARRAGHRAARELRPARPPAHPRHPRRPARHAARRDRRRGRRRRRRDRVDGGHDLAAGALRAGRRHRPLRPRDRARPRRRLRAGALLGGHPHGSTRRSSRGSRRRPAGSTPTRSPAGSSPTCASRRSRSASARSSSRSRTCTPPPTTSSATS